MEAGSRSATVCTVIGALLGAAGTLVAAYINVLKPSEKQVESSEQYRAVHARLSQLEQPSRTPAPKVSSEQLLTMEASNASLRTENTQLRGLVTKQEFELKHLSSAAPCVSSFRTARSVNNGRNVVASKARRRSVYVATIDSVTRTHDDSTISMTSMLVYPDGRLGAHFYVDGKSNSGMSFPGETVATKTTRDTECKFFLLSLEKSHKAPSTSTATLVYICNNTNL